MTTTATPAAPPAAGPARTSRRTRQRVIAGTATVLALAGIGTLAWWHTGSDIPSGSRTAPIALPASIGGLKPEPAAQDRTALPAWQLQAREAGNGATVVARTYGPGGWQRSIRVVAARTDLTGKLDLVMPAGDVKQVGSDRCTQDIVLVPNTKARIRPTVMLCWRTDPSFSAYSFIIDPRSKGVSTADGAAALDAVWQAALTGK